MLTNASKTIPPLLQAAVLCAMGLVALVIASVAEIGENDCWYVATTTILLYAAGNPVLGVLTRKWKPYLLHSIPAFLVLEGIMLASTQLLAANPLGSVPEIQLVVISVTVFFFLVNFLVGFFRFIVKMMDEQV